jgi:hypothetical protein
VKEVLVQGVDRIDEVGMQTVNTIELGRLPCNAFRRTESPRKEGVYIAG